jgi:hypothetical protein
LKGIDGLERPQPFVLALVGKNKLLPSQVFTVMERRAIEEPSLLKGIDMAFKAHYVFNVSYQQKVKAVWEFLQCVIYELPGKVRPAVRDMRAYLMAAARKGIR